MLVEPVSGGWFFRRHGWLNMNELFCFRPATCDAAGAVLGARSHHLRRSHASRVGMNHESLHMAGRLLGHRRVSMTNPDFHFDAEPLIEVTGRLATTIDQRLW